MGVMLEGPRPGENRVYVDEALELRNYPRRVWKVTTTCEFDYHGGHLVREVREFEPVTPPLHWMSKRRAKRFLRHLIDHRRTGL